MIDTQTGPQVAEPTAPIEKKPRMCGYEMDLTEAEAFAIEALRQYQEANQNPALLAHLQAWEILQLEVDNYREGNSTYADTVSAVGKADAPERFAAIVTIARLFDVFLRFPQEGEGAG